MRLWGLNWAKDQIGIQLDKLAIIIFGFYKSRSSKYDQFRRIDKISLNRLRDWKKTARRHFPIGSLEKIPSRSEYNRYYKANYQPQHSGPNYTDSICSDHSVIDGD